MRIFLTGGTGFICGRVARSLCARGDRVEALVRNPAKAADLHEAGCELIEGDLSDREVLRAGMRGCDAVVHGAAMYEVGIPKKKHADMYAANVTGTENVLGIALEENIPKVLYVSTVAVFGNTHGKVVDESYERDLDYNTSYYDETKHQAHLVAKRLIAQGLPCVIVQPGGVYGPDDHSELGNMVNQFLGHRLPLIPFPDLGLTLAHVDDIAAGIVMALDQGRAGESYVLAGDCATNRELLTTLAKVAGRRPPKHALPTAVMKLSAPAGAVVGPVLGFPPNISELIKTSDGVTYWATREKASSELGFAPRPLEQGLRDMLVAEGKLSA